MIYPNNFEQKIGFDIIRHEVERRCISAMGVGHCRAMAWCDDYDLTLERLTQTAEFKTIEESHREFPLNHYHDLREPLRGIGVPGTFIAAESLFKLQGTLVTVNQIAQFFARSGENGPLYPALSRLTGSMQTFPEIADAIGRILDKFGHVKDTASPRLAELRGTLNRLTAGINGIMRRVLMAGKQSGILDNDAQPAVRDGRLVLPVSPMHKRKVRGIVHDESASGHTVFIEPEEIVEANNHIRETEAEIAREIIRILTALTDSIRPHSDELLAMLDTLGALDFVRAKALFAIDINATMPHLSPTPQVEWYHAVHPTLLLALRSQGKEVVPMDLRLDSEQRIVVISGPNAGGKSVCLKTTGVVQYMLQCGMLPPVYDNSHMGMFKHLFLDIGDQQSLEDDLSTYSSHLQNMKALMVSGDRHSLVLIDEMGSGTEPQIGGAIAQAILEQLNANGVYGVVTTHYQNLKQLADVTPGMVNGAMLYDRQQMRPLFQLSIGYPGSSFAIEIARKTGLPEQVVQRAGEIAGSDYVNMDRYVLDIARDRRYWEKKRHEIRLKEKRIDTIVEDYNARLEQIALEQRRILKDAKDEAREIVRSSNAQVERTIREIREMQAEKEKTRAVRQQLDEFKQRLSQDDEGTPLPLEPIKPRRQAPKPDKNKDKANNADRERPLAAGDRVALKDGGNTVGTIINIDEKYALVAFGQIKTRVESDRLVRSNRKIERSQTSTLTRHTSDEIRERQLQFSTEIDVRGMRADEALQAVTYFIDDAIQFNSQRVRILHGTGTGALRQVIRQYLRTVAGVKSCHDEHVQLGGAGITVVELL